MNKTSTIADDTMIILFVTTTLATKSYTIPTTKDDAADADAVSSSSSVLFEKVNPAAHK